MTMVDPATGWFEITEVPYYSIEDVKRTKTNISIRAQLELANSLSKLG